MTTRNTYECIDKITTATMDAWSDALAEYLVRGDTGTVFESGDFPPDAHFTFEAAIRTATQAWIKINGEKAN